jgi:hypothetical protein
MADTITAYRLFNRSSPKSAEADSSEAHSETIRYSISIETVTHPWATPLLLSDNG